MLVKQGADLQCNTMAQMIISAYLENYDIDAHILSIREVYRRRRDIAISTIRKYFPSDIKYTVPEGGLFLWLELNEKINAAKLLEKCLEHNVAFVPGNSFFPNNQKLNTLRINFSNMQDDKIAEGLIRMSEVLSHMLP